MPALPGDLHGASRKAWVIRGAALNMKGKTRAPIILLHGTSGQMRRRAGRGQIAHIHDPVSAPSEIQADFLIELNEPARDFPTVAGLDDRVALAARDDDL
jgi:hypothetical protein